MAAPGPPVRADVPPHPMKPSGGGALGARNRPQAPTGSLLAEHPVHRVTHRVRYGAIYEARRRVVETMVRASDVTR